MSGSKQKELVEKLKAALGSNAMSVFTAVVTSVNGETCSILYRGIEIEGVRLKATVNGANSYVLITPKKDTYVTVQSLSGDLRSLLVIKVDDADSIEITNNDLVVKLDLNDNKLELKNSDINIIDLFKSLADKVDSIYNAISGATPSASPDGGAGLKATMLAALTTFPVSTAIEQEAKKLFK